ncbi:hypothetical protein TIFTF001_033497 [Ficus carica]|uniref:Uncharacterized protein n=1 Tax=Ficus carica TaxID=3494 RepID=A0AA88DZA2_FICCA|nr:hypothetical protein TIFTF001_033497 [Ficus carica]
MSCQQCIYGTYLDRPLSGMYDSLWWSPLVSCSSAYAQVSLFATSLEVQGDYGWVRLVASSKGLVALAGTELGRFGGGAGTGLGDEASGWLGRLRLVASNNGGGIGALDGTEMGGFGWSQLGLALQWWTECVWKTG